MSMIDNGYRLISIIYKVVRRLQMEIFYPRNA